MTDIQGKMKELFGNSCYAYCIAFMALKTTDIKELTKAVLNGWLKGLIEDDGYVSKPLEFLQYLHNNVNYVEKVALMSLSDLPDGLWIVEYKYKGSHFVVANKNGVVFDPAGDSNTVKNGLPFTYRKYK